MSNVFASPAGELRWLNKAATPGTVDIALIDGSYIDLLVPEDDASNHWVDVDWFLPGTAKR